MKATALTKLYASVLITLPLPFYLKASTAGTWMALRFARTKIAHYTAPDEFKRANYYIGFIASQAGFWMPERGKTHWKYRWVGAKNSTFMGRETNPEYTDEPAAMIGRLSLWKACRAMRLIDKNLPADNFFAYRAKPKKWWEAAWGSLCGIFAFVPTGKRIAPPPPWTPPALPPDCPLDEPNFDAFAFPDVNLALKPDGVEYNWKTISPSWQAKYKAAGWHAVPRTRHPELADFKFKKSIVWNGVMLMECPKGIYQEMQAADYERSARLVRAARAQSKDL